MQRKVFDATDSFRFPSGNSNISSISVSSAGKRLFAGTTDGIIHLYECRDVTRCSLLDTIKKHSKERKSVSGMVCIDSWRVMVCIVDGVVTAYDSQFYQLLSTIVDNKGCHLFAISEKTYSLVLANKKKIYLYSWNSPGFVLRKEFNLNDVPKSLHYMQHTGSLIIGYRKHFELLDLVSSATCRIADVEKEHKMFCLELPTSALRPGSVLLSLGTQGTVIEYGKLLSLGSQGIGMDSITSSAAMLEWVCLPVSAFMVNPFIVSVLSDNSNSIEIHDIATLNSLQKISVFPSPVPVDRISMSSCFVEVNSGVTTTSLQQQYLYVCNAEQVTVMKMVPLSVQIETLTAAFLFEQAINLYQMCADTDYTKGIALNSLYEANARSLLLKGDFEKAVWNYMQAGSDFILVIPMFPDLIPKLLQSQVQAATPPTKDKFLTNTKPLTGSVLHRAAAALVDLLNHHRPSASRRAQRAEAGRLAGIGGGMVSSSGANVSGVYRHMGMSSEDGAEEYGLDPDADMLRVQVLDTVLLSALVQCNPPRRSAVVDLLSRANWCQIESSSVMLASQGNSYTEALLWLFRSQNQHTRVLQALSEEKCVGAGSAWTRDQFYRWRAEYLRWLWFHETDLSLPKQALLALPPVLQYDAELGLSVLTTPPSPSSPSPVGSSASPFGGRGVTISEVVTVLQSVNNPKISQVQGSGSSASSTHPSFPSSGGGGRAGSMASIVSSTPLLNGHCLAVAFVECLTLGGVGEGVDPQGGPPALHDEFTQLLVDGLPADQDLLAELMKDKGDGGGAESHRLIEELHRNNQLDLLPGSADTSTLLLYKVYRSKLQRFLSTSQRYHAGRVLQMLPPLYLHEKAMVLARLSRHMEVLCIYIQQLGNLALAEEYCDRVFTIMTGRSSGGDEGSDMDMRGNSGHEDLGLFESGEIYLILFQVILDSVGNEDHGLDVPPSLWSDNATAPSSSSHNLTLDQLFDQAMAVVVRLSEKYFDRVDPNSMLELIFPPETPLMGLVRYFQLVMEFGHVKKRNLQISHQLLRVKEVSLRTSCRPESL